MSRHFISWRGVSGKVCRDESWWSSLEEAVSEHIEDQQLDFKENPGSYEWTDPELYAAEVEMLEVPDSAIDTMLCGVLCNYHYGAKFKDVGDLKALVRQWNKRQVCFNFSEAERIDFSGFPWESWLPGTPILAKIAEEKERRLAWLASLFSANRFRWSSEKELQDGIETLFRAKAIRHHREALLSHGVIDFLVGGIGVEVKIKGQLKAVLAQLRRYAEDPQIESLVLVTGRLQLTGCPDSVGGKPLRVVPLVGSLF